MCATLRVTPGGCARHTCARSQVALAAATVLAACEPSTTTDVAALTGSRAGMGAILSGGGATFRVWAPLAQAVWVTGDFNGWGRTSLVGEGNGNFSGDVANVSAGQKYKLIVRNAWGADAWKADPRAFDMESSVGASVLHDPASYTWRAQGFTLPGRNEQVFAELHVGTLNAIAGGAPGTWRSAGDKLDHLRDLGINMIELMPVFEFPGDVSAGYNPSEPFAPESAYGTPDDLKWFIDEAHLRGIGVVLDVVHNHYGPNDLPMWCFSGDCLGAGGEYFYTDWRAQTPWGSTRPDYGRPEVRDYIKDQAMMLLGEYRADGLRWDATKYIRTVTGNDADTLPAGWNVLRYANDSKNATQPWKLMIAEDFGGGDAITRATAAGGAGFDAQWAGEFVHPIRTALIAPSDSGRDMTAVQAAITQRYGGQAIQRIIYTESHDEDSNGHQRLPEEIWPGNAGSWAAKKRSTLGAAILLTSPGVPLLFEGQELLEDGWFAPSDPVDWSKATTHAGITSLYRDLIHLRRNWFDNTRGLRGDNVNVFHLDQAAKVIAYHRWDAGGPGDDVVVVANFSSQWFPAYEIGLPRRGIWYVRFNSDWSGYSSDFGNTATYDVWTQDGGRDGLSYHGSLALGPYSAVILSQ
jgi:1,4-alpha-glucan branching enzyme